MSELEFILIGVSMVLALALGKLLEGAVDLTGDKGQYWIHSGWVVSRVIGVILYLWVFRGAVLGQEQVDWGFGKFLLAIAGPVTIFMQAHLLLTIDSDSFIDWRSHFYSVRRRFFLFLFIGQSSNIVSALTFVIPASITPFLLVMGLSIAGMISSNARIHAIIVVIYLTTLTVGLVLPIAEGLPR
jgi:hypothetical protein